MAWQGSTSPHRQTRALHTTHTCEHTCEYIHAMGPARELAKDRFSFHFLPCVYFMVKVDIHGVPEPELALVLRTKWPGNLRMTKAIPMVPMLYIV